MRLQENVVHVHFFKIPLMGARVRVLEVEIRPFLTNTSLLFCDKQNDVSAQKRAYITGCALKLTFGKEKVRFANTKWN